MLYPLLTQRLSIVPLALSDLETFVSYRQDPEIARFQSWETSYSTEQATELIKSQAQVLLPESGNWLQLAIHDRSTGELLGDLAIHTLETNKHSFEIGFSLATKNQGGGIALEAVGCLLSFLFDIGKAATVIASCDSRNLSSIKLLTACGFKEIPSKSWSEYFKNESIVMNYFELTHSEFTELKN